MNQEKDIVEIYYGDEGDDVSGDGTLANPFLTFRRAVQHIPMNIQITYDVRRVGQKLEAPSAVQNIEEFWINAPPNPSPRLVYWRKRIDAGWRPNRRIRSMGYYEAAKFYGIYIFEYLHVLSPFLVELDK